MVNEATFREIALSFPEVVEEPHFEKKSFRIRGKIFATLSTYEQRACLKLSVIDQSVFCSFKQSAIYPVANKWGKQGWTLFALAEIDKDLIQDALSTAYQEVVKKTNYRKRNSSPK